MHSLLNTFRPIESRPDSIRDARVRASAAAKRIAEALTLATIASVEMLMAGEIAERLVHSRNEGRAEYASRTLKLVEMSHLRLCADLAAEMQAAMGDALGSWVIREDVSAWGLSGREARAIAQVSGSSL